MMLNLTQVELELEVELDNRNMKNMKNKKCVSVWQNKLERNLRVQKQAQKLCIAA